MHTIRFTVIWVSRSPAVRRWHYSTQVDLWQIKSVTWTKAYRQKVSACCKLNVFGSLKSILTPILHFSAVLYTLSKQAKALSANKLHLQVNNRLQTLKIPEALQEQIDVSSSNGRLRKVWKYCDVIWVYSISDQLHIESIMSRWFQRSRRTIADVLQMFEL